MINISSYLQTRTPTRLLKKNKWYIYIYSFKRRFFFFLSTCRRGWEWWGWMHCGQMLVQQSKQKMFFSFFFDVSWSRHGLKNFSLRRGSTQCRNEGKPICMEVPQDTKPSKNPLFLLITHSKTFKWKGKKNPPFFLPRRRKWNGLKVGKDNQGLKRKKPERERQESEEGRRRGEEFKDRFLKTEETKGSRFGPLATTDEFLFGYC